jgi:hypothetical protein
MDKDINNVNLLNTNDLSRWHGNIVLK